MLSKRKKILLVVLGIAVVLLLNKVGGSFIKNTFYTITSPLQKLLYRAGDRVGCLFEGLFKAGNVTREKQELVKQNILLQQELSRLGDLAAENQMLKQALALAKEQGFQLVAADVVLKQPDQDTILISVGKTQGIAEAMPVVTEQGVLLGRIGQVFDDFANVLLISSEKTAFDVEIQTTSSESVLAAVEGGGKGNVYFNLAPRESAIKQGDIVKTAALGGKFPKGLLVGQISDVRKNDAESFQEGVITSYFSRTPLLEVFVITNFNIP